jgi:hypothetical protein
MKFGTEIYIYIYIYIYLPTLCGVVFMHQVLLTQ